MKKISMLNPYSFYYLSNQNKEEYLNQVINDILNTNCKWKLLKFFNDKKNNVRSYVIFESKNKIALIDFNFDKSDHLLKIDFPLFNYLKCLYKKKVYLIILNNFTHLNHTYNNMYDIYINDSNKDSVKYLFLDDYNNQLKLNKDITDCLYTMDDKTYDLYLHEIELKNKL